MPPFSAVTKVVDSRLLDGSDRARACRLLCWDVRMTDGFKLGGLTHSEADWV